MAETTPQKTEPAVTGTPKEGFGAVLRHAREEQGISLGDMAARSRLSVPQLKAIESESLDQLPEPVYVRAFIRGIASVLGVDAAPLVADYTHRYGSPNVGVLPDHDPRSETVVNGTVRHKGLKIAAVAVLVLAVAAGAWCFWNDQNGGPKTAAESEPAVKEAPAAHELPKAEAEPAKAAEKTQAQAEKTTEEPKAEPKAATAEAPSAKAAAQKPAEEEAREPLQTAEARSAEEPKLTASAQPGVFRTMLTTNAPCWVQIVDPNGKNLLAQEMKADATVTLDVPKGSRVTVGNAQAMQFMVDGKPFDLSQVTRGGISRFVLK